MITKNENCGKSSYEMFWVPLALSVHVPSFRLLSHAHTHTDTTTAQQQLSHTTTIYDFFSGNHPEPRKRADYEFLTLWLFYCLPIFHSHRHTHICGKSVEKEKKRVVCDTLCFLLLGIFFLFMFSFAVLLLFPCGKSLFWNNFFMQRTKMGRECDRLSEKTEGI